MDNQNTNKPDFYTFCEQIRKSAQHKSITFYAVDSFLEMCCACGTRVVSLDVLKLWLGWMLMKGMKFSSAKRYFGRLHTLYEEWRAGKLEDPFADAMPYIDAAYQISADEARDNYKLVKRLLARNETSAQWSLVKTFFYLLYNVRASFSDVVNLTFESYQSLCPQIDDIVDSQDRSHGRKYVFELRQGKCSEAKIVRDLTVDLAAMLRGVGMKFSNGFSRDSITSMWISGAISSGIDLRDIRSVVPIVPADYSALSLISKQEIGPNEQSDIICRVANGINDNSSRWFVMKIRSGVSVDDIKSRIEEELPGRLKTMMLFYPTHTSIKKDGKKTIKEEIPYIPNVLFFKTQRNKVRSLFAQIGDLAWCFRVGATPECDYSVISNAEMTNFQRSIGQFTPDIKMELVEMDRPLDRGRRVRIIGGMMAGYEGEIIDIDNEPGMRMFFLSITTSTLASWKVRVEDVFIEPLELNL